MLSVEGGSVVVKVAVRVPHLIVVSSVPICNESCLRSVLNEYPPSGGVVVKEAVRVPNLRRDNVHFFFFFTDITLKLSRTRVYAP